MATRPAGFARSRYRALRGRRRLIRMAIVVVLVGVLGVVAYSMVFPKDTPKLVPQVAAKPVSFGARQAADVNLVAGAVGQYVAANGALPQKLLPTASGGLVLCGATCDVLANTISGLTAYQPSNVYLMGYSFGLVAPNQTVMYLVPGAKCQSNGSLGASNPTPHSMVILYEAASSSMVTPQCVVL
jgi:hypothetical protein